MHIHIPCHNRQADLKPFSTFTPKRQVSHEGHGFASLATGRSGRGAIPGSLPIQALRSRAHTASRKSHTALPNTAASARRTRRVLVPALDEPVHTVILAADS